MSKFQRNHSGFKKTDFQFGETTFGFTIYDFFQNQAYNRDLKSEGTTLSE